MYICMHVCTRMPLRGKVCIVAHTEWIMGLMLNLLQRKDNVSV